MNTSPATSAYTLLAEFDSPEALLAAARRVHDAGYRRAEAYSPFPVEGLAEVLEFHEVSVARITLLFGLIGAGTGFGMCWYANVLSYPWNIGGRPANSWPAWIPITFELGVLFAALSAAIGMIILNGLPRLHHPLFESKAFLRASRDRFFLAVDSRDPRFEAEGTRVLLAGLKPLSVSEVPA